MARSRTKRDYLDALDETDLPHDRRAALTLMAGVRHIIARGVEPSPARDVEAEISKQMEMLQCANCDGALDGDSSLVYCSEFCGQQAGLVRYVRTCVADGRIEKPDIQEAVGMKFLQLTAGGYPRKARELSDEQRREIFERDNYKCQLCGEPANAIDHVAGSSSDPSNLRALCSECNRNEALKNVRAATEIEQDSIKQLRSDLAQRIASVEPKRFCDDRENWRKAESKIRAAHSKLARKLELKDHGLSYQIIEDFFEGAFAGYRSAADYLPAKHRRNVICNACGDAIPKNTLYIRESKSGTRACIDCITDYTDEDEDVDGYIAHTMARDD